MAGLSAGQHTFGSARTRRSLAKQPDGPFPELAAARPSQRVVVGTHRHASQIWRFRILRRPTSSPLQRHRLDILARNGAEIPLMVDTKLLSHDMVNSLAVRIAIYPEVVRLTELLLDLRGESRSAWIWNRRLRPWADTPPDEPHVVGQVRRHD